MAQSSAHAFANASSDPNPESTAPSGIDPLEWDLRVQLAACYRIFDYLGWSELIFNHISMRLPGPAHHFLINPFGLWYNEVTASNLVKIDLEGKPLSGGEYPVNRAGFVIHSAIHAAREDARCIMHTHTTATMAVACQAQGLLTDNFYSAFLHDQVAYHDFEGLTVYADEKPRLVASLGDKNLMLCRSHGPISVGRTLPEAFMRLWFLQRACEVQLAAHAAGVPVMPVSEQAIRNSQAAREDDSDDGTNPDEQVFAALVRKIDAIDTSYRA